MFKKIFAPLFLMCFLFALQIKASVPYVTITEDETITTNHKKAALEEFKSLSKKERKTRIKEAKSIVKQYKADKRAGKATEHDTVLLAILAILLPPLAVYLHQGSTNSKFWLSVIFTLLFWIPGVIYALLVIFGSV